MNKSGAIMSNSSMKNPSHHSKSGSLIDFITEYESLVIFGGFGVAIMFTIIITGVFQAGPVVRDNLLYNAAGAMAMAFGFIYIIFKCMGTTIVILGKSVDMGMLVYMSIVLFVMFVFGN